MTPADITNITKALQESMEEIVSQHVQSAVREIPWRVDEYINRVAHTRLKEMIANIIDEKVIVSVRLR
jgi:hypothetical protein